MLFSLDVIRARKGDCLILHFGSKQDPRLMMIDGGPSNVYEPHLKPRLDQIRTARGLQDHQPLKVDALLVSHVDDDHIKGILEMTKELREIKERRGKPFVRVKSIWHNSFDDLLGTTPEELQSEAHFGTAALAGEIEIDEEEGLDVAKILASIPQGRDLRIDAEYLEWKPNHKFCGKLIMATENAELVTLDGGLAFTVVGPMKLELAALQKKHDEFLRERKERKKAEATLAAFKDASVPNLSSIVLLAEVEGKKMLLTGDARGDKILTGLQLTGLLGPGEESTLHVDLLKVPHHGSANNLETSFFRRVTADHYVFSGNGEHGNPERESLEMLLEARGNDRLQMHFTYPLDEIDKERERDWNKHRAQEIKRKKANVRPAWSPEKHSLAVLFEENPEFAKKAKFVKPNEPHLIDLHEKVDF